MSASSAIAREWDFKLPIAALVCTRRGDFLAAALGDGSLRLMAMRREMLTLIDRRNAIGGREECLSARRLKQDSRSLHQKRPLYA